MPWSADIRLRMHDALLRSTHEAVALIDSDGYYLFQNDAHRRLIGYDDQELAGQTPAMHLGAETFARVGASLAATGHFHGECVSRTKRGPLDIELTAFTVRGEQGQVLGHVGIKRDLTARKRAEAQLATRLEQLEALYTLADTTAKALDLDTIHQAALDCIGRALRVDRASILLFDAEGVMRFRAWKGLSAAYRTAVDGHSPWGRHERDPQPILVPDVDADPAWQAYLPVFRAEGIRSLGFIPLVHAGRLLGKFMLYGAAPRSFTAGEVHVAQTIAHNVAFAIQRQELESRYDHERRLLKDFVENGLECMHWVAADGTILWANRAELRLLGYAPDEYVGRNIRDFHLDGDVVDSMLRTLAAGGSLPSIEARMRCKDGSVRHVLVSSDAFWEDGRFVHSRCFTRDITPQKQAEDELRRLNAELEARVEGRTAQLQEAVRELESFNYSVSHDLRTPLQSIRGYTQLVLHDAADRLDPAVREYVAYASRASERMAAIIEGLLKLSRVNLGEPRRERVDLGRLAADVAEDLRAREPSRRVDFAIADGLLVDADPNLARVVLDNLVGNAWKFTARSPSARIEVGRLAGPEDAFYVRDNGAGFEQVHAQRIFEAFTRLHPANEYEGVGIGLATVQRIVRRHGGRVWAEGELGRGATVYFTLAPPRANSG